MQSPFTSFNSEPENIPFESHAVPNKTEAIEVEPRFNQIREDLASMFMIYIKNEQMLHNAYVKNELYSRVDEDIKLLHHFALDYMAEEKLHPDGEPLLTKEDFTLRGIRTLQHYGTMILAKSKEPARSRIKELFVRTGMFTQHEADQEVEALKTLH